MTKQMNFTIKLLKLRTIDKIEGYWNQQDYLNLLEAFDYDDAASIPEAEVFDMLLMAISDLEPEEAAERVLRYKLGSVLKDGQIKTLSYEMLDDKVAEEYPVIALHYPLFNINRLLYEAYNGKFPRTLASVIDFELKFSGIVEINKEIVLRTFSDLLSPQSLLKRLFDEQLDSENELADAEGIIWELRTTGDHSFQLITSDYWLNKEDIDLEEYSGTLREEEIHPRKPG